MITYRYDRRDIFGYRVYTEDSSSFETLKDVRTAFRLFSNDQYSSIAYDGYNGYIDVVFYWENKSDFDNRIVTIRKWHTPNNSEYEHIDFFDLKKAVYSSFDRNSGRRKESNA